LRAAPGPPEIAGSAAPRHLVARRHPAYVRRAGQRRCRCHRGADPPARHV